MEYVDKIQSLQLLAQSEKGRRKTLSNINPFLLPQNRFLSSQHDGYFALLNPTETSSVSIMWIQCYAQLEASLEHFSCWVNGLGPQKIITEILGTSEPNEGAAQIITSLGFAFHDQLIRMRLSGLHNVSQPQERLHQCSIADLPQVIQILSTNFDPLMERLPPVKEIESAIHRKEMFFSHDGEKFQGMYWGEVTSSRGELKFIVVDPSARGLGIGQKLLSHFLSRASSCARVYLWVLSHNERAIALYKKNGFVFENQVCDGFTREIV